MFGNMSPNSTSERVRRIALETDPLSGAGFVTGPMSANRAPVFYSAQDEARDLRREQVLPSDMSLCDTRPTAIMNEEQTEGSAAGGANAANQTDTNYSTVNIFFSEEDISPLATESSLGGEVDTRCATVRS
jgi:hypothetical protein